MESIGGVISKLFSPTVVTIVVVLIIGWTLYRGIFKKKRRNE